MEATVRWRKSMAAGVLLTLAAVAGMAAIPTIPVELRGNVRFNNASPEVLAILESPGDQGIGAIVASARSTTLGRSAGGPYMTAASRTSADFSVVVDTVSGGAEYQLSHRLLVAGSIGSSARGEYHINPGPTRLVFPGPAVTGINSVECAGVLRVSFVDAAGAPVAVSGGTLTATDLATGIAQAGLIILPGRTREDFLVRGGATFRVDARITTGTGDSLLRFTRTTNVAASCDRIVSVTIVVPAAGTLGAIRGKIDMIGEFEAVFGNPAIGDPAYTRVSAISGPDGNERRFTVPGVNFTAEASGPFVLPNLPPSTATPAANYVVFGEMGLRRFRQFQYFRTPSLGAGSNSLPSVIAGETLDLGTKFVMTPGHVVGSVVLKGPPEARPGSSPLRGLRFSADPGADADWDGLPDRSIYGNFGTVIIARGVDRRAAGASLTAVDGVAVTSFDGSYSAPSGEWVGDYDLITAGLSGEGSIWRPNQLSLAMVTGSPAEPDSYINSSFGITDHLIGELEVPAGGRVASHRRYALGEVCLQIRSTGLPFWSPNLAAPSQGTFRGANFWGEPADYEVNIAGATGSPAVPGLAGSIVVQLPEGDYHLVPSISTGTVGAPSATQLRPIDLRVRALQQQCLTPCLQIEYELPACAGVPQFPISGVVRTLCSNEVKRLTWRMDDGPEILICEACGPNPTFNFTVGLPAEECGEHDITVTATDSNLETAINRQHVRFDTKPPVVACPPDRQVACETAAGAVVSYSVSATDNCPGTVNVVCTPPSGSTFAIGSTLVRCVATDQCGNASDCKFTVTVVGVCQPCELVCPTNLVKACTSPSGAEIFYAAPTPRGNCPPGSRVECNPPSGSTFAPGVTPVFCKLLGPDGKLLAQCEFTVEVRPGPLSIERSVTIRWHCGVLEGADHVDGPWADIPEATSPYTVPATAARRFYRARE